MPSGSKKESTILMQQYNYIFPCPRPPVTSSAAIAHKQVNLGLAGPTNVTVPWIRSHPPADIKAPVFNLNRNVRRLLTFARSSSFVHHVFATLCLMWISWRSRAGNSFPFVSSLDKAFKLGMISRSRRWLDLGSLGPEFDSLYRRIRFLI